MRDELLDKMESTSGWYYPANGQVYLCLAVYAIYEIYDSVTATQVTKMV